MISEVVLKVFASNFTGVPSSKLELRGFGGPTRDH